MKKILCLATLFILIIAGVGSTVLVLSDWNSLASGDSFTGLGILLFLIGAGIGALIVTIVVFILSRLNVTKPIKEEPIKPKVESIPSSYNIQVTHVKEDTHFTGTKQLDDSLLRKLGLKVKNVLRKISISASNWKDESNGSDVFTPTVKSWEKGITSMESISTATPRIYVLPPESPSDTTTIDMIKTNKLKTKSDAAQIGVLSRAPDSAILDIQPSSTNIIDERVEQEEEQMNKSLSSLSQNSDHPHSADDRESVSSLIPKDIVSSDLSKISLIDSQLGDFISSLSEEQNNNSLTFMLSIMVEEVLPRPDSGLLKRMLRMSEIPVGKVEGSTEPILYLRTGSECHLSVGLIQLQKQSPHSFRLTGPHSVTLKPLDGDEIQLHVNCEEIDNIEHVGSVFWDLKKHASPSMAQDSNASSTSTVLTPVEMTLGFHLYRDGHDDYKSVINVDKTFMCCMRSDLTSIDVKDRLIHEDLVVDFVLSKMELISMPTLLMFLKFEDIITDLDKSQDEL